MTKASENARVITAPWLGTPALQNLLRVLSSKGHEAKIVGGAVRNTLLQVPVKDIDIATTQEPETVARLAEQAGFHVYPTGIEHGTVTVVSPAPASHSFEVTTLRCDISTDGRRATVAFIQDWLEDAMRRDFTINAIYCDYLGVLFDPFNGAGDLDQGRVLFIGDAEARIREDYLRILRFFRFHAAYGRGALNEAGLKACRQQRENLATLSAERIREELLRIMVQPGAGPVVQEMQASGMFAALGLAPQLELFQTLLQIDDSEGFDADGLLRLIALVGTETAFYQRLRLSNAQTMRIRRVLSATRPTPAWRERERKVILYQLGADVFYAAVRLAWAQRPQDYPAADWRELLDLAQQWPIPEFPLSGADLLARGWQPGPAIGATLTQLEDWWIAAGFPQDKTAILAELKKFGKTT